MGQMMYIPNFGIDGIVVSMGGDQVGKVSSGADALISMGTVQVLDTASGMWYEQTVTGSIPDSRKEFCIDGAASSNRTFEILLYAGWNGGLGSGSIPYDEAFVLSLPSFRWFKADYPALHPRHGLTCNHLSGGQIVTIGGVDTTQNGPTSLYNGVFNTQDPFPQGLGVFDLNMMGFRSNYTANQTTYTLNPDIQNYYDRQLSQAP